VADQLVDLDTPQKDLSLVHADHLLLLQAHVGAHAHVGGHEEGALGGPAEAVGGTLACIKSSNFAVAIT